MDVDESTSNYIIGVLVEINFWGTLVRMIVNVIKHVKLTNV